MQLDEVQLVFQPEEKTLKANELSNFLYYFRAVYAAAVEKFGDAPVDEIIYEKDYIEKIMYEELTLRKIEGQITELFFRELYDNELLISKIKKESPFEIWIMGLVTALVISVILSGGEVDLKNMKFKLNPLGEGIAKLKQAFSIGSPKPKPKNSGPIPFAV